MTVSNYQALAEFRYRVRGFWRVGVAAARNAGIQPQQHQLLLAIKGLPKDLKPTIGTLAERLQIQHHSAVELVDRAEKRGLLLRSIDPRDRRVVIVTLSARGEAVLRKVTYQTRAELRSAAPALVKALRALASGKK